MANQSNFFKVLVTLAIVAGIATSGSSPQVALAPEGGISFPDVQLRAKAAIVYDALTGDILYAREHETQLPLASLTKIMTAVTALETLNEGQIVTISQDDAAVESANGLLVGEPWRLKDILRYMLFVSSNDAASAVASSAGSKEKFVGDMNGRAQTLGLSQTYFLNESGLDVSENNSGAYGSAYDIARLLAYAITREPEVMGVTRHMEKRFYALDSRSYDGVNTNGYVAALTGAIASKTGTTDLAGGNLAVAFDVGLGHPMIVVVLGSTPEERFSDVEKLVRATLLSKSDGI